MDKLDNLTTGELLNNALTAISIWDKDGNCIYQNAMFLKLSGLTKQDMETLNVFNLKDSGYVFENILLRAYKEKQRITTLKRILPKERSPYNQLITASPILDGNGELLYIIAENINLSILENHIEGTVITNLLPNPEGIWEETPHPKIIANSPEMKRVLQIADQIAQLDCNVLVTGETGTGKDIIANYIHQKSHRNQHKIQILNCAALPENLLESELFGYEKGAFTGALNSGKEGLIQQANGGTLFLDEINSMPLSIQGKLLRVLETRKIKRIGAIKEFDVDFRLVAATNQDLKTCIENGTFRADLYYRLAVVPIEIPPLRFRQADIMPLTIHFLDEFCKKYQRMITLDIPVMQALLMYTWPGNVRELKNIIERLVVTTSPSVIEISKLPEGILGEERLERDMVSHLFPLKWEQLYEEAPQLFSLKNYMDACEREVIEGVMKQFKSTRKAAEILKTDQSTIVRKRQKYKDW